MSCFCSLLNPGGGCRGNHLPDGFDIAASPYLWNISGHWSPVEDTACRSFPNIFVDGGQLTIHRVPNIISNKSKSCLLRASPLPGLGLSLDEHDVLCCWQPPYQGPSLTTSASQIWGSGIYFPQEPHQEAPLPSPRLLCISTLGHFRIPFVKNPC